MLFIYTRREPVSLELLSRVRRAWHDVHVHVVLHYTAPSSFRRSGGFLVRRGYRDVAGGSSACTTGGSGTTGISCTLHYQPLGVAPDLQLVQQVLHYQPCAMVAHYTYK